MKKYFLPCKLALRVSRLEAPVSISGEETLKSLIILTHIKAKKETKMQNETNGPTETEKQELAAVLEQANQLNLAGYQITILNKYEKKPKHLNWQNIYSQPEPGMTGVGIVGGSVIKGTNRYIYIIDIDIYRPEKRDRVYHEILALLGSKEIYAEITTSGGYHLIICCEKKITTNKVFRFREYNYDVKDKVEFFTNGQCLIAPSRALQNDKITIGKYVKLPGVDIEDTAVLTIDELNQFLVGLKALSQKYQNQKFHHNHMISVAHRAELVRLYHELKDMGFACAPLYGGSKYSKHLKWNQVRDDDFESTRLTGIVIKLGKQPDGTYIVCLDFDHVKEEMMAKISDLLGKGALIEQSVSGGYHLFFRTKTKLDINVKWKLPNKGGKLEVLWMDQHTVNIAPTCACTGSDKAGAPVYKTSKRLSGSFDSIEFADVTVMQKIINGLIPDRKKIPGAPMQHFNSNSEENAYMLQRIHQFGDINEIDKQIKLIHPNTLDLLDTLKIRHSSIPKPDSVRFFSLYANDGTHPDALLFHNQNDSNLNNWSGYSVQDFHSGDRTSFSQYLCKYSPGRFEYLMDQIGFGKTKIKTPISTVFTGNTITIECDRFISEEQHLEVMNAINDVIRNKGQNQQAKIVITAPTGCGKTEMFYRLAKDGEIRMILALAYTTQVLQGKEKHTIPTVLEGLCGNDRDVSNTGSLFITYDKAKIVRQWIVPDEYIMVIDEAHNIVNQNTFRNKQLRILTELSNHCKAVVYMTATPEYINYRDVDLVIKIKPVSPKTNHGTVVKYSQDIKSVLSNVIVRQHLPGTVDVVYIRNTETLQQIENVIKSKRPDLQTHVLFADIKSDSNVYMSLSKYQRLSEKISCTTCDILFTTNLIVDGVNINDINIGNVYLVDPGSTTDLVQFPARFRHGYREYFIFVTGNQPDSGNWIISRQALVEKYYYIAYKQKQSYEHFNKILLGYGLVNLGANDNKIQLVDQYDLLDDKGNIQEYTILLKVQQLEAMRMRWDVAFLKDYLEKSEFGYNFQINEKPLQNLMEEYFTSDDIASASESLSNEREAY